MKITVLGKKIVAFFAIALLGFSLAGCLEESGGDVTLEKLKKMSIVFLEKFSLVQMFYKM